MRIRTLPLVLAAGFSLATAVAQTPPDQIPRVSGVPEWEWINRSGNPYGIKPVSPLSFRNSPRIYDLMRGGLLYLSLQDSIALALENNLDVEFQRFTSGFAASDLLRARGGGILRGVPLFSTQPPTGVGGPATPLLNSATPGFTVSNTIAANVTSLAFLTQPQSNLSISPGPFSLGSPIPVYDPTLVGAINWQHASTPQSNPFITGANVLVARNLSGNGTFVQGFSPGTQIGAVMTSASQTNNSIRGTLNPFNSSSFGITLTQPLLRGFGIDVNRRFIRIAQNGQKLSDLVFRQQAIDTVSGITRLYYDLVSLLQDVTVKQSTLALARKLYEDNRVQVEQGTLAPIEVVRAQALIAASIQDLANSEGLAREQELVLKTVLTRRGTAEPAIRNARIVPTTPIPAPATEPVVPLEDLLSEAFRNRPDLASANLQLDNANINIEGSRNALRPEVDLVATAQNAGLAGTVNPLLPPGPGSIAPSLAFVGGFGTTLEQIFRRNFPTYGVGVQLNLPLRNRVAQADYVRDVMQLRQTQIRRQQVENQVRLEVEDALISLQRARAAYEAAVETRKYNEESLAAEQEKFAVGLSTTFLIIQYQSMLAQARSTEVAAGGAYAKARVALEHALATTLEASNVAIDEALRGQVPRPPAVLPPPNAPPPVVPPVPAPAVPPLGGPAQTVPSFPPVTPAPPAPGTVPAPTAPPPGTTPAPSTPAPGTTHRPAAPPRP